MKTFFLFPSNTSRIQPLDAEVTANLKVRYLPILLARRFCNIDVGKERVYGIDILAGLQWAIVKL